MLERFEFQAQLGSSRPALYVLLRGFSLSCGFWVYQAVFMAVGGGKAFCLVVRRGQHGR